MESSKQDFIIVIFFIVFFSLWKNNKKSLQQYNATKICSSVEYISRKKHNNLQNGKHNLYTSKWPLISTLLTQSER